MQINKLVTIRETLRALQSSTNISRDKSSACHHDGTSISTWIHTKQMQKAIDIILERDPDNPKITQL
eukprot:9451156-Ditylum_brightwellii.AAC.1